MKRDAMNSGLLKMMAFRFSFTVPHTAVGRGRVRFPEDRRRAP